MRRPLRPTASLVTILLVATTGPRAAAAEPSVDTLSLPPPTEFCTQEFSVSTVRASPASVNFGIDYEFDEINHRAEWRRDTTLQVVDFDPETGLPSGPPVLVDTGIVTNWPALGGFLFGGNGAEWAYSARGSELFYMKPFGSSGKDRQLVKASETSPGQWATEPLPDGTSRAFPLGSQDPSDSVPRVALIKPATEQAVFRYDVAIRDVPEDPGTEWSIAAAITLGEGGGRWVPGRRQLVLSLLDEAGVEQAAIYDLDTREFDMITHYTAEDDIDIDETWASELPSVGPDEIMVWFVVNNSEFHFYRKDVTGDWVLVNAVNPSEAVGNSAMPYILSPEPCTFLGESYMIFQASVTRDRQMEPGEIYLMMPGSSTGCHFRRLSPGTARVRKAPECLALPNTLAVYFVEWSSSGRSSLYKAETGLP